MLTVSGTGICSNRSEQGGGFDMGFDTVGNCFLFLFHYHSGE